MTSFCWQLEVTSAAVDLLCKTVTQATSLSREEWPSSLNPPSLRSCSEASVDCTWIYCGWIWGTVVRLSERKTMLFISWFDVTSRPVAGCYFGRCFFRIFSEWLTSWWLDKGPKKAPACGEMPLSSRDMFVVKARETSHSGLFCVMAVERDVGFCTRLRRLPAAQPSVGRSIIYTTFFRWSQHDEAVEVRSGTLWVSHVHTWWINRFKFCWAKTNCASSPSSQVEWNCRSIPGICLCTRTQTLCRLKPILNSVAGSRMELNMKEPQQQFAVRSFFLCLQTLWSQWCVWSELRPYSRQCSEELKCWILRADDAEHNSELLKVSGRQALFLWNKSNTWALPSWRSLPGKWKRNEDGIKAMAEAQREFTLFLVVHKPLSSCWKSLPVETKSSSKFSSVFCSLVDEVTLGRSCPVSLIGTVCLR